ncbi:type II toxin-antitoxin system antitoxin SocA domain-containing protein [uncultured Methylobacterium sp.]|jgi:uncharacterized phage-associated protein|uniref:Panacea domain-containing protein n=1 Tax=uncultured Methylobacterium sp. TaxID=157278 RepID=UPI002601842F|nr:type II toxin-antitoxin system antitoxin SocA domain-containing protein [uncultured Methylobacterium sp.]
MAARLDSVSKFICENSDWTATNLQLQKLLYLAQMIYMGRNAGSRLVDANFEAWDYGPVEPNLYKKVRMFGSRPISDVFFKARQFKKDDARRTFLEEFCRDLLPKRAGELVEITHWDGGAWAKHYIPGARGIQIPDRDIALEYADRIADGHLKDEDD